MADDVQITFGAKIDDLIAGVKQISDSLDSLKSKAHEVGETHTGVFTEIREILQGIISPIRGIRQNLGELAEAFTAGFAIEKIAVFFEKMAALASQTETTSAILGISTKEVGKFNAIALVTGTSTEGMSVSLQHLGLNLQRALTGAGPSAEALRVLGLRAKDLIGLPLTDVVDKIANKFQGWQDGLNKTAIAMTLLGRSGAQMIPVLNEGSRGLSDISEMAVRTGTAMSGETVSSLSKIHEALVEFGLSVQGIGITIASSLSPAMQGLMQILIDLAQSFNAAMKSGGMLADIFGLLGLAIKAVVTALAALVTGLELVWAAGVVLIDDLGHLFIGLGKAIYDSLHFNFAAAANDIKGIATGAQETMAGYLKTVTEVNQKYAGEIKKIWSTVSIGPEATNKAVAPSMNLKAPDNAAAMKAADGEVKALQEGLARQKILLDQGLAQFQLTEGQKVEAVRSATDKEYALELAVLQKELAISTLSAAEKQTVLNKIAQLEQKHATDTVKINGEAVAAVQKQWQTVGDALMSSFNGQLRGMLAGTTSFLQAFKSIVGDMIIFFIQEVEKMVVKWLVSKLTMATADKAATVESTAAAQAAVAAQVPATIASIQQKVAQVYAGAAAFFAPLLGPGAPEAALAVSTAVDTAATAMAIAGSAEQGAYRVGGGLWQLHPEETVLPAPAAQAFRDMAEGTGNFGSGGGPHFHGMLLDGQSVARFFRQYSHLIPKGA
jgi:hypothetical protein